MSHETPRSSLEELWDHLQSLAPDGFVGREDNDHILTYDLPEDFPLEEEIPDEAVRILARAGDPRFIAATQRLLGMIPAIINHQRRQNQVIELLYSELTPEARERVDTRLAPTGPSPADKLITALNGLMAEKALKGKRASVPNSTAASDDPPVDGPIGADEIQAFEAALADAPEHDED